MLAEKQKKVSEEVTALTERLSTEQEEVKSLQDKLDQAREELAAAKMETDTWQLQYQSLQVGFKECNCLLQPT